MLYLPHLRAHRAVASEVSAATAGKTYGAGALARLLLDEGLLWGGHREWLLLVGHVDGGRRLPPLAFGAEDFIDDTPRGGL